MKAILFLGLAALAAPPASAQLSRACGPDLTLRLSALETRQGDLFTFELRSRKPAALEASWAGGKIPLWAARGTTAEVRRGLVGVDLEKAPGKYELKILNPGNARERCSATVLVRPGRFPTERLTVPKKFVEPDAPSVERANRERDRLRAIFAAVSPERLWTGKFRVPVEGRSEGSNFGRRRVLNGQPGSPHGGADFPAATGTPIHAAQRGRVVLAEELYFAGNTVVLDHGLGVFTLYGHLSEIAVQPGDLVDQGALLGKAGATGRVTGPHLHWGLTIDRARVNPVELVKRPDL